MQSNSDWLPGRRSEQLAMAKSWHYNLKVKGRQWDIPEEEIFKLGELTEEASEALARALSTDRTAIITAKCRTAFSALVAIMRLIKARRFFSPPLYDPDYIALGLRPPVTTKSMVAEPTAQAEAEITYPGVHMLMLHIKPLTGSMQDFRSDYGCRIYYGLMPYGGATQEQAVSPDRYLMKPPESGKELPFSNFTHRKKELFNFNAEDSGKTAYFCIRYENAKGMAGPWGPVFSAIIP